MPIGIITNAAMIVLGSLLGVAFRRYIPAHMISALTTVFGFCGTAIGIFLAIKLSTLPAVVLALILGTIIGELLQLEKRITIFSQLLKAQVEQKISLPHTKESEKYIEKFITLLLLFCTGSTGILGAMTEGLTGSPTILLAKAILDLFTSAIFAASMGILIATIAIPQFLFFITLYFSASLIMPLMTPTMLNDFIGCGGIIAIMAGFRILEIKSTQVTNILPALLLAPFFSWVWSLFF